MKLLDRRSLSFLILAFVSVLVPFAGAAQDKPHVLRTELVGPRSALVLVEYHTLGTERSLAVRVRDIPLPEITVATAGGSFVLPLTPGGDGLVVLDSRFGDRVPVLKEGDSVAILASIRGSTRVLLKGTLKPAS
jgi:hypothetical protein